MAAYIEERIRRAPPAGAWVVPGSTPVVAFGDSSRARVATLGLNPSRAEFRDRDGRELTSGKRRFETLSSLELTTLATATPAKVERVLRGCREYFSVNPYRRWFDQLELVVNAVNASYYSGTACHLDLVQWATDPTWGGWTGASGTG